MSSKYIPAFITLAAGALTSIVCIVKKFEILYSLELLLGTLVVFFILGLIAQKILNKVVAANTRQRIEKEKEEKEAERKRKLEEAAALAAAEETENLTAE